MKHKHWRAFITAWLARAAQPAICARAFKVALVVGTVLNLINQGDALFGARPVDWLKLILTFLVPYCVSTYSAVEALRYKRGGVRG